MQSGSNARLLHLVLICAFMIYGCAWTRGEQKKEPPSTHPEYVMRFERMGGYLGVHDQFFIYPDGRIIGDSGKTARVGPATVADWIKNISPAATKDAPEPSLLKLYCSDCFTYRITFYDERGIQTAFFADPLLPTRTPAYTHFERMRDQIMTAITRLP